MFNNLRQFAQQGRQALHKQHGAVLVFTIVLMIGVFAILAFVVNVSLLATSSRQQYANAEYVAQAALGSFIQSINTATPDKTIFDCDGYPTTKCLKGTTALSTAVGRALTVGATLSGSNKTLLGKSTINITNQVADAIRKAGPATNDQSWIEFGSCDPDSTDKYRFTACTWGTPVVSSKAILRANNINAVRVSLPRQQQKLIFSFLGTNSASIGGGSATVVYDPRRAAPIASPSPSPVPGAAIIDNPSLDLRNISTKTFILADLP